MMKKRIAAVALCVAMTASVLSACGSSAGGSAIVETKAATEAVAGASTEVEAPEVDQDRKTTANSDEKFEKLVVAVNADPQDLNPWNKIQGAKAYIYPLIYETLFDFDTAGYYPVLAESYEVVDDLHWKVKLHDNITDSAGNNITADDVLFSYQTNIDSGFAVKFSMFDHLEKVDDYTVEFVWTEPIDGIAEAEWPLANIPIFSQKAYEEGNFATMPVATGPYVVKSFTAGSNCVLELRDDYWCDDISVLGLNGLGHSANVKEVEFQVISESAQQVIALQNGTIDFSYIVPTENLADFQEGGAYADKYSVDISAGTGVYFLMGNMSGNSIWSDENFRKAVYYALDSDAISAANNLWPVKALCSPKFDEYYSEWSKQDNYETVYDPELAKEYLEKTGYNGETLTLLTSNAEVYKNSVTMIQALLQQIGINVELKIVEESACSSAIVDPNGFDMYVAFFGGNNVIGGWNRVFNNVDYGNDLCAGMLDDPQLVEMYKKCSVAENFNLENMTEMEQYVIDNAYCYTFSCTMNSYVFTNKIAKLESNAQASTPMVFSSTFYLD